MKQVPAVLAAGVILQIATTSLGSMAIAQNPNNPWPADPYYANDRPPDDRFKADILVVVAHPDDEIMAAAFMAEQVDKGKRVALVWTTRGDGGTNTVGPEQAAALGDIREDEAIHAAYSIGVQNVWDLGGPDTPSQNPLESLETCNHGRCLDRLVRIVRLTRPSIILTWLPLGVTGENHGDHQASGVLATEAFDMAGDPTMFSEQVSPAREPKHNMNRLEGLRPWQPEKIYYFSNPTHTDFFAGQGPEYPTSNISPKRHISYAEIAAGDFQTHRTQGGGRMDQAIAEHHFQGMFGDSVPLANPTRLILGKSLVKTGVTDDVFTGIVPEGVPYQRSPGYTAPTGTTPTLELGNPWAFYKQFYSAHGLDHLGKLIPAEVTVMLGTPLTMPMILDNPSDSPMNVSFEAKAPEGWTIVPVPLAEIGPHQRYYLRLVANGPATVVPGWHQFSVTASSEGKVIGTVELRVELKPWALPE